MSNAEHKDATNDIEVEITDLTPSYEDGRFVKLWLQAQQWLSTKQWKPTRSTSLRLLLLTIILIMPFFISSSNGPEQAMTAHPGSQSRCITRLNQIIIYDGTVTARTGVHVTIIVITQTANSASSARTPDDGQGNSPHWQAGTDSNNCK